MDTTSYIALSQQMALQRQMAVVANNLANMTTTGFKREELLFETVLEQAGQPGTVNFVHDVATIRDPSDGPITQTSNPLDLAIAGQGHFQVETANGTRYTRNGHFSLSAAGEIVDAQGRRLLDVGGAPLSVPVDDTSLTVAPDGTISNKAGVIGRIGVVGFAGSTGLRAEGGTLLASDMPAGPATGRIVQGALEGSNVQGIGQMTRMIEVQRAFEGTQRLIETQHDLTRRTVDKLGGSA